MSSVSELYDITIVGGGPAGIFAAFYAGLREMRVKVIEALPQAGGQLSVLYPEKFIYDIPGHPRVLARELVKQLHQQAEKFRPEWCMGERVLNLVRTKEGYWEMETDKGTHLSRTVIIAAGVGAFAPRKLPLPSMEQLEGRGVHYFMKNKAHYRGKKVLIVGGGDSAVDAALMLNDWAEAVYLVHRREGFRAHESSVTELYGSGVRVKVFHEIKQVSGDAHLERVVLFDNRTQEEETLEIDELLMFLGFKTDIGPIQQWGLELEKRGILVNSRMETNLEGVYAAGDIAIPRDSVPLKLIATGFAQAAMAVNFAKNHINPADKVFPGHSSEKRL